MPRITSGAFRDEFPSRRDALVAAAKEKLPAMTAKLASVREWLMAEFSVSRIRPVVEKQYEDWRVRSSGQPTMPPEVGGGVQPAHQLVVPGDRLRADRLERAFLHLNGENQHDDLTRLLSPNIPRQQRESNSIRAIVVCGSIIDPDAGAWLGKVSDLSSAPWLSNTSSNPPIKGRCEVCRRWGHDSLKLMEEACIRLGWVMPAAETVLASGDRAQPPVTAPGLPPVKWFDVDMVYSRGPSLIMALDLLITFAKHEAALEAERDMVCEFTRVVREESGERTEVIKGTPREVMNSHCQVDQLALLYARVIDARAALFRAMMPYQSQLLAALPLGRPTVKIWGCSGPSVISTLFEIAGAVLATVHLGQPFDLYSYQRGSNLTETEVKQIESDIGPFWQRHIAPGWRDMPGFDAADVLAQLEAERAHVLRVVGDRPAGPVIPPDSHASDVEAAAGIQLKTQGGSLTTELGIPAAGGAAITADSLAILKFMTKTPHLYRNKSQLWDLLANAEGYDGPRDRKTIGECVDELLEAGCVAPHKKKRRGSRVTDKGIVIASFNKSPTTSP